MRKKLFTLLGIVLCIYILWWFDLYTGCEYSFFIFYFIPVSITAWFFGFNLSIICSILCVYVWFFADDVSGQQYSSNTVAVWNTLIRLISFLIIGWSMAKIHILLQSEKIKTENLQKALSDIKTLERFLSICCVCKKIRNEDGKWQDIEFYIANHSETKFEHGFCPECAKKAIEESGLIKT